MPGEKKVQEGVPERRSFQGIENLKPQLQQGEPPSAPATTQTQPAAEAEPSAGSKGEEG